MRGLILTFLFVGCTEAMAQPWSGVSTVRNGSTTCKGFAAGTWPSGWSVPTPTNVWWAEDPEGDGTATTSDWTKYGTTVTDVSTPFCAKGVTFAEYDDELEAFSWKGYYLADLDPPMNAISAFTVCAVFKTGKYLFSGSGIVSRGVIESELLGYALEEYGEGVFWGTVGDYYAQWYSQASTGFDPYTWHVVCMTQSSSFPVAMDTYFNKTKVTATGDTAGSVYAGYHTMIGSSWDYYADQSTLGTIVGVFYWNSVLTQTQVNTFTDKWTP